MTHVVNVKVRTKKAMRVMSAIEGRAVTGMGGENAGSEEWRA